VHHLGHEDFVELRIVVPEHVQVNGNAGTRKDILEDVVHVVPSNKEQVKILTGIIGVRLLERKLLEVRQVERLERLRRITNRVARAFLCLGHRSASLLLYRGLGLVLARVKMPFLLPNWPCYLGSYSTITITF